MDVSHAGRALEPICRCLDQLPAAAFLSHVPDSRILHANHRACRLSGGHPAFAHRLSDLVRGVAADGTALAAPDDPIATALQTGTALDDADAVIKTPDGWIPIRIAIEPVIDSEGEVLAALSVCQSAAASGDAAAALRFSEQRLALALSAGRLGVWQYDLSTETLTASAQCKANHGLTPGEPLDLESGVIAAIEPEHQARFRAALDTAIECLGSFEIEVPNRWPDGSLHWLLVAGRVVDPDCLVGVTLDLSHRRRAEEALVEADRRKDEFLTVLAHELRGPLAPILTAARLLQLKGPPDSQLMKARDTIVRQTMQLTRLVDDLLDVGRISAGKVVLDKKPVELNAIVRQAIETCAPAIDSRRHRLNLVLSDRPINLDADRTRLVQIICNLLNNAAKYMREGGRIDVSTSLEGDLALLRVRDEGVGLAPEMLDRIFERFVQVGSSRHRAEGGLGIGLSLVKALVELHGGSVEARSEGIGTGSEFILRLPVAAMPRA